MSKFFEDLSFFVSAAENLKMMFGNGRTLSYESASFPPRESKQKPSRQVNPKSGEGQLRAIGWRLVPVPSWNGVGELNWDIVDCWLVLPPDESTSSARFSNRRAALHWAQKQVGLRPKSDAAE